jgi:hypothetical protein
MHRRTPPDRRSWETLWDGTVWEKEEHGRWLPLGTASSVPLVMVTAWNPSGALLPLVVNQARDAVLHAEMLALDLAPIRARGRSAAGDWHEEGWLIPHAAERTRALLRRYGQFAGWITGKEGAGYLWSDADPTI